MRRDCSIKCFSVIITLTIIMFFQVLKAQAKEENTITYNLAVSFDIPNNMLNGTAHIIIPPEKSIHIFLDNVDPTGILLNRSQHPPGIIKTQDTSTIRIAANSDIQELFISYTKQIRNDSENFIEPEGITLLHSWYPKLSEDARYSLSAEIPTSFQAIAESDQLPITKNGKAAFSFSKRTNAIHFIAAPFARSSIEVRPGLQVYGYFLKEDQQIAKDYLENAKKFILRYENIIGPYPYNHFAIVENHRPTGFGMPTFTLLGKSVIRLPFIKDTSLGHEIVHSWFGNSVTVKEDSGNWCEGLTSYLSDWLYRVDKDEGPLHRKENIVKYLNLVDKNTVVPLNKFQSASNYQHNAKALRSVGYIRGAFLFHELKLFIGKKNFNEGIHQLYYKYRDTPMGWSDIQKTFEDIYSDSLESFFHSRLNTIEIPDISIEDIAISSRGDRYSVELAVKQNNVAIFDFILPIKLITATGESLHYQRIFKTSQKVTISSDLPPVTILLDPEYDLLRTLNDEEIVPTLSAFMGPKQAIIIVKDSEKELYVPLIQYFREKEWPVRTADKVKNSELKDANIVFLGTANTLVRSLFGSQSDQQNGISLDARTNPLNRKKSILLVSASNTDQIQKVLRKLRHYGKYSSLRFTNGLIISKQFTPGGMGMMYKVGSQPIAVASRDMLDLDAVINAMRHARAVYVGETHSSMTDHYLQLLIIKELFKQNPNIVIGLEMFPKSSQQSLDDYTLGDDNIDESNFLKQSEYFKVWRFDYRYYKKIIDFAKEKKIKLVALNIDREIVSEVFRNGSTDNLSDEQLREIPEDRNLALQGYHGRLQMFLGLHKEGDHGSGDMSGFIQAQAIWDEAMAANIAEFLQDNPKKTMIILAGSQHTRKDNGVPPRVAGRIDIQQVVVESFAEEIEPSQKLADYYLLTEEQTLPPAGKIGITLEEKSKDDNKYVEILTISPQSKAKESGILPGDQLLSIDGFAVTTMEDIRISMVGKEVGDMVAVKINRETTENNKQQIEFTVELYNPDQSDK